MNNEDIRAVAARAASRVFAAEIVGGNFDVARLWSLCVFFELFIRDGGNATMEQFGPDEDMPPEAYLKLTP